MKVLMLGWELPPDNSGGLGVACYQLCKSLARTGVDIDFILPYESQHRYEFMNVLSSVKLVKNFKYASTAAPLNPYDSHMYAKSGNVRGWLSQSEPQDHYEAAVDMAAESHEYDLIHAHDWMTFRAALRAKQKAECPLIVHVHSIERDRSAGLDGNPMVREIEALTFLLADRIIAVSQRTKDMISKDYSIPADKIEVMHNSLDLEDVIPLDGNNAYFFLSELKNMGWKVVVNIGRLTSQKGLPNFMNAAQAVVHKMPKTIFMFVGSGDQYHELIELSAELGIAQNVVFAGFQRGKKWRDAYAIADLFVMPSVSEPFGLTPFEAVGYGTPALISKQSGVSEVFVNCLKIDFWDVDEMANQIAGVLKYDSLRDELHANAWQEYQRLGWDNAARQLLNTYEQRLVSKNG